MDNSLIIIGIILVAAVAGVFIFHVVHHRMFCRFRRDPKKSHCGKCGHREICRKYHHKKEQAG